MFRFLKLRKILLPLSLLLILAAGIAVWGVIGFFRSEFPDVTLLKTRFPHVIYQGKDKPPLVELRKSRPDSWVSLSEVSKAAIGAIIVSEDWAFYQHKGYDLNQIKEAINQDLEEGRFARGASTITQQVAKNVFLGREKNLWRKAKELVLAVRLEKHVGKRRILETYLNIAEWGEGIFGIKEASRLYFSKLPSELSAKEGAFLAMLLPSPKRYSQSFRSKQLTDYARRTIDSILEKMTQAQYLNAEEKDAEAAKPLSFESVQDAATPAPVPTEGVEPSGEQEMIPQLTPESDESGDSSSL